MRHRIAVVFFLLSLLLTLQAQPAPAQGTATPTDVEVILDVPLDTIPQAPAFVGIARLKFPPGSSILGGSIAGPRLFLIEAGTFAFAIDDPATIWRGAGPGQAEEIPADSTVDVAAADLLVFSGTPPFTVTNTGEIPASLLDIVIWPPIAERIRPFITQAGVIFEPLTIGDIAQLPPSPARLLMQKRTLPREARLGFELESGPRLLYVESGILGISSQSGAVHYSSAASNAPGSVSGRLKALPENAEALLTAGGAAAIQAGSTGAIRNMGRTTLVILELSIVSQ